MRIHFLVLISEYHNIYSWESRAQNKPTAGKLYVTPTILIGIMEKYLVNRIPEEVFYAELDN